MSRQFKQLRSTLTLSTVGAPYNTLILWQISPVAKSNKSKYLSFDNTDAWYVQRM